MTDIRSPSNDDGLLLIYIQIPFHMYESLFNKLIYINDYKAIPHSVSCRP